MGQNCLGRWSPTILSVRSRSRTPSPPASRTAQKCRGNRGIGTETFDKLIILAVPQEPGPNREKSVGSTTSVPPSQVVHAFSTVRGGIVLFIPQLTKGARPLGPACFNSKLSHLVKQRGAR